METLDEIVQAARSGRLEEARLACGKWVAANPGDPPGLNVMGVLCNQAGLPIEAEKWLRRALDRDAQVPKYWTNLGNALRMQARVDDAREAYRQAVMLAPRYTDAWYNLGLLELGAERPEAAVEAFRQADALNPSVEVLHLQGIALRDALHPEQALECFTEVLHRSPDFVPAYLARGEILQAKGEREAALADFENALAREGGNLDALVNVALLREALNKLDGLEGIVDTGLAQIGEVPALRLVKARLLRRRGELSRAAELLAATSLEQCAPDLAAAIHHELGQLHDREGRVEAAYISFKEANRIQAMLAREMGVDASRYLHRVEDVLQAARGFRRQDWVDMAVEPLPVSLAFVVGFPRSGTTLLDQILDSHPDVHVMEERSLLSELTEEFGVDKDVWPGLWSCEQVNAMRRRYLELASREVGFGPGEWVVDKFPLNLVRIPTIARLFPEAKIILALRHPADVCLSCFMHLFGINDAMANFYSFHDAARLYGRVMALWEECADKLPMDWKEIRYERVVSDFREEVGALLAWLDLPWHEGMERFYEHARARGNINTPSYHQVTEPLYKRAAGRWERYRGLIGGDMGLLEPAMRRFGYE